MTAAVSHRLRARSAALRATMEGRIPRLMLGWLLLVALASAARIATSPIDGGVAPASLMAYLLLATAPVLSAGMALDWFRPDANPAPRDVPAFRTLAPALARRHPLYGAGGIMLSLLGGLLLNIVMRAMEYMASLPALSGSVPHWLAALQLAMTFDVVVMTSLYAIAFVAALRHAPVFPRLLMAIWAADLGMQLLIREVVMHRSDLPTTVASALSPLLSGNIDKVLMSVALWLPYLLLSKRVNLTYRHRLPR